MSERTLREYADSICSLVKQEASVASVDAEVTDLLETAEAVSAYAEDVTDKLALTRLLVTAGLAPADQLSSLRGRAALIKDSLDGEAFELSAVREAMDRLKTEFKKQLLAIRDESSALWRELVDAVQKQFPPEDLLSLFRSSDPDRYAEFERVQSRVQSLSLTLPASVEESHEPAALRAKLSALLEGANAIPSTVRQFFAGVERGLPLSDLDAEVLDWLRAKGLLANYVVRPQGAARWGVSQ